MMRTKFDETRPLRVMVVDDSSTIRRMIALTLERDPRVTVVGEASDSYEAREKIKALSPDLLTLDIEMPGMDGLEFLSRLMRLRPMPVVMISTLTREGSVSAVRALALGAVECVDKRHILHPEEARMDLVELLLVAGSAQLRPPAAARPSGPASSGLAWNGRFAVIGASTGGVDALTTVLAGLPADTPPVVIAQHMPAMFLESFTERLDARSAPKVVAARAGDPLTQGVVMIAPGGRHHVAIVGLDRPRIELVPDHGAPYVPLIDTLFRSAVPFGSKAVGVLLTGMGRDGADALLEMRRAGATTVAEDAATAVVDGMPRAARDLGAAAEVKRIDEVAEAILAATSAQGTAPRASAR